MPRAIRHYEPKRYYMFTNRTEKGIHFFRPDEEANRIVRGCLARAADRYEVELVCFAVLSNHFHLIARCPEHTAPSFMEYFQRELSKRIKKHREHGGTDVFAERYNPDVLLDEYALRDKIAYVVNKPVREMLVARASDWPGVNSQHCHQEDNQLTGRWLNKTLLRNLRQRKGEHSREEALIEHTVPLHVPECFEGEDEEERLEAMLELIEEDRTGLVGERTVDRRSVLGVDQILSTPWEQEMLPTDETYNKRRLAVASTPEAYNDYRERRRAVTEEYRQAVQDLRQGREARFPPGTIPPGHEKSLDSARIIPPRDSA